MTESQQKKLLRQLQDIQETIGEINERECTAKLNNSLINFRDYTGQMIVTVNTEPV